MYREELRITLKSDLCVGSGYSYAGIVDSDVSYDECGLPYIPAKRLKGCLREAAELLGLTQQQQEKIFGKSGADKANGIFLGNAFVEDYQKIYQELKYLNKELKAYATPQNVLEQFTTVKAQTKIMDNGVSKDNSLRFTRVVNHYSPISDNEEMVFVADVEYRNMSADDIENFKMVVKALRNIGMNRNRGLGSIKCNIQEKKQNKNDKDRKIDVSPIEDDTAMYVLEYSIKNMAPLVLSADNDYTTEKYISGQSVLGFFASEYLKDGNQADKEFENTFLKNQVIFGALYPCDNENRKYYPAPAFINHLKKTKKYVNVSKLIPTTEEDCQVLGMDKDYARGNGNQPKKLKGKFVSVNKNSVSVKEVPVDIIYHHTKASDKENNVNGDLLYSFEVVRSQQIFSGTIIGRGSYIKTLCALLEKNNLKFGKSKSAQYGNCVLLEGSKIKKLDENKTVYPKGSKILVVLESDSIFIDACGYTVDCNEVRKQIRDTLNLKEQKESNPYTEIEVRRQMGYYSKWNLRRLAIPVVRAGSTFEYMLDEDLTISQKNLYVGERNGEGYGKIRIFENNITKCCMMESELKDTVEQEKLKDSKNICKQILFQEMKEKLYQSALNECAFLKNSSTVGRITMMLTESINKNPDDAKKAYLDYWERISSIKDDDKKKKMLKITKDLICEGEELSYKDLKYVEAIRPEIEIYKKYIMIEEKDDEKEKAQKELKDKIASWWSDYFLHILIQEKYRQKGDKK